MEKRKNYNKICIFVNRGESEYTQKSRLSMYANAIRIFNAKSYKFYFDEQKKRKFMYSKKEIKSGKSIILMKIDDENIKVL